MPLTIHIGVYWESSCRRALFGKSGLFYPVMLLMERWPLGSVCLSRAGAPACDKGGCGTYSLLGEFSMSAIAVFIN
jgi:hypothetical protein